MEFVQIFTPQTEALVKDRVLTPKHFMTYMFCPKLPSKSECRSIRKDYDCHDIRVYPKLGKSYIVRVHVFDSNLFYDYHEQGLGELERRLDFTFERKN